MTTSTVPITLPASTHRAETPVWAFHVLVAWITYTLALLVWAIVTFDAQHGRRHTVALAAGAALAVLAAVLAVALR